MTCALCFTKYSREIWGKIPICGVCMHAYLSTSVGDKGMYWVKWSTLKHSTAENFRKKDQKSLIIQEHQRFNIPKNYSQDNFHCYVRFSVGSADSFFWIFTQCNQDMQQANFQWNCTHAWKYNPQLVDILHYNIDMLFNKFSCYKLLNMYSIRLVISDNPPC